ncbi:MAG: methyltransferase RsmF C-terminal domain-like protein [Bacteroidota bacterium]
MRLHDTFLGHLDGLPGFSESAFVDAHLRPPPTSIRVNPYKPVSIPYEREPIPWSSNGFYLTNRPSFTFDPLFHAGTYYVQEASSQLLEQFLIQSVDLEKPLRVLDLCAAPGGKSTHLLSLLNKDSLLVSNEVIRSRAGILSDNLDRWGCSNIVVTQEDPSVLGRLSGFFDVIVADAPCSGSGLFRKDEEAMGHWSLSAVAHCAARQNRILRDIWPALREGGILIYSTCSFSREEDEMIVSDLLTEFDAELIPISYPDQWGIVSTEIGYRCWPHAIRGEGFFISAIRKRSAAKGASSRNRLNLNELSVAAKLELSSWWQLNEYDLFEWNDTCWALPISQVGWVHQIGSVCTPLRIGTRLGAWSRKDWIPDHALALSLHRSSSIPTHSLDRDESIRYLQKGVIDPSGLSKGWQVVTYLDQAMGWVKGLGNRVNNYYPTHLRILKQSIS